MRALALAIAKASRNSPGILRERRGEVAQYFKSHASPTVMRPESVNAKYARQAGRSPAPKSALSSAALARGSVSVFMNETIKDRPDQDFNIQPQ